MKILNSIILTLISTLTMAMATSCKAPKKVSDDDNQNQPLVISIKDRQKPESGSPNMFIPRAIVYRTNGNYAEYVPDQVSADGKTLVSFPAPSDISADSRPIELSDGWLVDRRGIGENSRFTSYTYGQYAKLATAPSPAELLKAILPGAIITDMYALPCTLQEAKSDTNAVNSLFRRVFPDCRMIISAPVVQP